jgi:outer membrane receptor protein involved in Fe transport
VRRTDFIRLLLIVFFALQIAAGQSTNGTISGIVFDPAGKAVPHAELLIVNDATGISYPGATNSEGIYAIPNLPPGPYRIQVSKYGFKTLIKPDIVLHVEDALAINFTLPLGAASEIVTVEGGAPLINTENASVSTVVDRQFAENLPLNGRSFQSLILLTPGVALTASNPGDSGQFSVNGQRASANYWMVDGVSANVGGSAIGQGGDTFGGSQASFSVLGGTNSLVSVDAMQEFRIQTSTYAPEFGRTPGAQISILTRSGTNEFHGTAFDYFRNDVLDANDWFNGYTNSPTLPKAKERQNDFGGTFSGPVLKDRTFVFFSYEGLRLRLPQTTLTTVPDASFTPGGTTNSRGNAIAAAQPYLNAFPLPNPNSPEIFASCKPETDPTCPSSGQKATGSAAFNASYSNPATLDAYSLRVDHRLTDKWNLFGRYSFSPSGLSIRGASGLPLSGVEPARITTQSATVGATWMLSSETTNDLRFNYSKTSATSYISIDGFGGSIPLASLPLPSPFTAHDALFSFDIAQLTNGILGAGKNEANLQRQINVIDSFSLQKGSHSLKFGLDFRRLMPLIGPESYEQFAFFGNVSSAGTGSLEFSSITSTVSSDLLLQNLGIFAQDTWRVNPRFTVTYGLRWDVDFAPTSTNDVSLPSVTGFNFNDFSNLALSPAGTPVFKTPYNGVAPRFGVAYQLSTNPQWQTVLRGGVGIFYDLVTSQVGNIFNPGAYPFGSFKFNFGGTFPLSASAAAPSPIAVPANGSGNLAAFDPNIKLPYTIQWNVALEQALGKQQTISASYIGAVGRRLLQTETVFAPNPTFGEASLTGNAASSNYDALQIQFNRRLSHGLQTLASFTWSHSIDDGSAGSGSLSSNLYASSAFASENRGPSDFDIRKAFNVGLTYDVLAPGRTLLAKSVLCGWSVDNVVVARSAPPVNISDGDFSTLSEVFEADVRPDSVPGQPLYLYRSAYPGGKAINPNAFKDPPVDPTTGEPIRQGDVPRNSLRGFGAAQWDFAIHRIFPIHDALQLQFRAEMFNVLNHPNVGPPNGLFTTPAQPTFGLSTQTLGQSLNSGNLGGGGFSSLYQLGGPRSIQFGLKLTF